MASPCSVIPTDNPPRGRKWKYQPTPAIDDQIRAAYYLQRQGDRQALGRVSRRLRWPRYAVAKRGAELGVSRVKERPWSEEEEGLLRRHGHLALTGIQRQLSAHGFRRSCAGIRVKMTRLHIKQNLDGYSANALARGIGVDTHKVINWIRRGLLRAERRDGAEQDGGTWWIPNREVRRFVLRAPEEIDLARVEKIWFLDVLTNGRIGG